MSEKILYFLYKNVPRANRSIVVYNVSKVFQALEDNITGKCRENYHQVTNFYQVLKDDITGQLFSVEKIVNID